MSGPLEGRIVLVAGATRGAGRGSAVALGEAGATVYCTGRSTREHRSECDRPETIEETAELVSAAGGVGIAVAVDHLEAAEVEALVQRYLGVVSRSPDSSIEQLEDQLAGAERVLLGLGALSDQQADHKPPDSHARTMHDR
jgi:NAD(P)-dependent dehydrogenase (short-subunit alcohol dehydrogenase family)